MAAPQQALIGGVLLRNIVVTVGVNATTSGYETSPVNGSVSNPNMFVGGANRLIQKLCSRSSAPIVDFEVDLNVTGAPQSFFTGVLVQNSAGVYILYLTAAATYNSVNGTWRWGSGASPIWVPADAGTNKQFFYW